MDQIYKKGNCASREIRHKTSGLFGGLLSRASGDLRVEDAEGAISMVGQGLSGFFEALTGAKG